MVSSRIDKEVAKRKLASIHQREISFQKKKSHNKADSDSSSDFVKQNPFGRCPDVSSQYEKLNRIGEGTYGIVYRARDVKTDTIVALKRCLPHHQATDGFPITTLREISLLRELCSHPHIVTLLEVAVLAKPSGVFLVFEYAKHDLARLVDDIYSTRGKSPFGLAEVKCLSAQLLDALHFLHKKCIIHRDIKLSNLLYDDSKGHLQLADFGLARRYGHGVSDNLAENNNQNHNNNHDNNEEQQITKNGLDTDYHKTNNLTPNVVSLWYRPPELLLGSDSYTYGVDVWGTGCAISELILGFPLIKGTNEMDQLKKIFDLLGIPTNKTWPNFEQLSLIQNGTVNISSLSQKIHSNKTLLDRLGHLSNHGIQLITSFFRYDPDARISASQALQSRFFKEHPLPTESQFMPTFPSQY